MPAGFMNQDNFGFTGARSAIWHRFGTAIQTGQKAVEAFPALGLDWETDTLPVFAMVNGQQIELPEHRAHVRRDTGTVFGLVSDKYRAINNGDLARFADGLVDGGEATVETAGSLLNGKRVFVTLRLPTVVRVGRNGCDESFQFLVVSNGHGGFASFSTYLTSVRVVCQNTLTLSERDIATGVRFYHTGDLEGKLRQARTILGTATKESEKFAEQCHALANADISSGQLRDFLVYAFEATYGAAPKEDAGEVFIKWNAKRERAIKEWMEKFESEKQTLPGIQGTAWAALNAYTEWSDHERGGPWLANRPEDVRLHSNVFGIAQTAKRKVFRAALKMAGV